MGSTMYTSYEELFKALHADGRGITDVLGKIHYCVKARRDTCRHCANMCRIHERLSTVAGCSYEMSVKDPTVKVGIRPKGICLPIRSEYQEVVDSVSVKVEQMVHPNPDKKDYFDEAARGELLTTEERDRLFDTQ